MRVDRMGPLACVVGSATATYCAVTSHSAFAASAAVLSALVAILGASTEEFRRDDH